MNSYKHIFNNIHFLSIQIIFSYYIVGPFFVVLFIISLHYDNIVLTRVKDLRNAATLLHRRPKRQETGCIPAYPLAR